MIKLMIILFKFNFQDFKIFYLQKFFNLSLYFTEIFLSYFFNTSYYNHKLQLENEL